MKSNIISLLMLLLLLSCSDGQKTHAENTILPVEEYAVALDADTTAFLIDVRTPEEYAEGHIEGAVLMNVLDEQTFVAGIDTLDSVYTYYIYCRSGRRSRSAASMMEAKGLKVIDLQGGYNAWQKTDKKQKALENFNQRMQRR
ncbi:MAG: rhodanese-like domain-containing protein [Bacteroidaceae bacterium]|nr:rhodanese-like domain-containing protein [Bacteroidaceae bacterium]